jgi:predicted Zn-dependent protease
VSRALDLAERAVRASDGDEADASVHVERSGFARFAASAVHQPTLIRDESITVRVVRDGRVGCATTNRTDDEGLAEVARRAGEAADRSPVDPGFPGLQPPAPLPDVEGFDEETAAQTPEDQAEQAAAAIAAAPELGLYGYYTSGATEVAGASTTGHAVTQAMTDVSVLTLAAGRTSPATPRRRRGGHPRSTLPTSRERQPRRRPGRRAPARSSRRRSVPCSSPMRSRSSSSTSASRH